MKNEIGFFNWPDIKRMTGKSRVTIWRWIRDKQFPPAIKIGPNSVAWRRADYFEWERDPEEWRKSVEPLNTIFSEIMRKTRVIANMKDEKTENPNFDAILKEATDYIHKRVVANAEADKSKKEKFEFLQHLPEDEIVMISEFQLKNLVWDLFQHLKNNGFI